MAKTPDKDDDANSRFVWKPGDIVILPSTDAKSVLSDLRKLAQSDSKEHNV
jgi:hypothetical protein